jgi:hypothetical protein
MLILTWQPSEGEWCLEDLTGSVRLDLAAYFAKDQTSGGPNRAATKPAGNVPGEIHAEDQISGVFVSE